MSSKFKRIAMPSVFAAALTLAAMISSPALAGKADGNSVEVHMGDLDLTTDSGVNALHGRISRAARQVCGNSDIRDLRASALAQECRKVALTSAAPQVELAIAAARKDKAYAANSIQVGGTN